MILSREFIFPALHPAQRLVEQCQARFIVLAAGRRFGKTRLGVSRCVWEALRGRRVWWIAPTYKLSAVGWRGLKQLARQVPGTFIRESDHLVVFATGGSVQVRSGDEPDSLRGEGLDYVVLDEAAFMAEEVWTHAVRPALSDRRGRALFISTPSGRNWFWQLYERGLADERGEWRSFHFTTADNPHISADEIEEARRQLPERVFRQEYLAEFAEDSGAVFRNVATVSRLQPLSLDAIRQQHAGHELVLGVDWGKSDDYTVFSLVCATCRQQLLLERSNRQDYQFQLQRLRALVRDLGLQRTMVVAERNAMGEPLLEQLWRAGLQVRPFTTTASSKPPLIEALVLALERGELLLLDDAVQQRELQSYTIALNRVTGHPTYAAPPGLHDDTVMALALAWYGVVKPAHVELAQSIWG